MSNSKLLVCPICKKNFFIVKYEASHVYSYVVDSDAPGLKNTDEFLSFRYDNRELKEDNQYVECQGCGAKFPCSFNIWNSSTGIQELQRVIDSSNL